MTEVKPIYIFFVTTKTLPTKKFEEKKPRKKIYFIYSLIRKRTAIKQEKIIHSIDSNEMKVAPFP